MPARSRRGGLRVPSEARDHTAATLVHDVETARQPHQQDEPNEQSRAAERKARSRRLASVDGVTGFAPTEQLVEAAVEVAPDFVEIGRSTAAALTPLRIVEGHGDALRRAGVWVAWWCGLIPLRRHAIAARASRRGNRSASAASNPRTPAPVSALKRTARILPYSSRSTPGGIDVASHLFMARMHGSFSAPISASTASTAAICSSRLAWLASTTCRSRSASTASFNVARKAATRSCGSSRMKPTVSETTIGSVSDSETRRTVVSRVAKSWSAAYARAPVRRLNSVDLPAFVYPTSATLRTAARRRARRCVSRC